MTYSDGSTEYTEYDALGNVVGAVDALGNKTDYSYNAESLLTAVTYADGAKHAFVYDKVGNLTRETDETGGVTKYTYDLLGRVTEVKDALGSLTHYEYDPEGRLTRVTDANGNITAYAYDAVGRLVSEKDPLGAETKYAYTPEGWLKAVTDANGNITRYAYDLNGSLVSVNYAGEKKERNTYNDLGLLTTVTTDEGMTEYQYDKRGYLSSVTEPDGDIVSYTYDAYGNRASMTYPDGETVKYSYDELNRLVKLSGLSETVRYDYNAKGQRTETRTDKLTTEYAYDVAGNLVSQSTTGAYDLAFEYAYDKAGRITQESRTENGTTLTSEYAYDRLGQLTDFERSDGYTESYVYDPVGNMLSKTRNGVKTDYTYNAANQLVSDGENKYTYDKNGNLVQKGDIKYTYNAQNLLKSWTDGEHSESYTYNANRLLSSVTNDEGTTELTWDVLMGDGVMISASTNGQETNYSYGLERISAQTDKTRTEYIYDGRGSVAAEVSYNSAWYTLGGALSKKNVVSKSYTPFGEQIGEAVSGFGYNGEYYNANTGMVYLRARFYEPEMNRFSQKDILRGDISVPNSLNRYAYVQNDPVNYCDPSGMRQVKGTDASGSAKSYSVKKTITSTAATMAARADTMAYIYANEARMTGSAAAAKKAQQAIQKSYYYANEARMNGNGSSVYKTYGALQAVEKQTNYTNSRGSETVAETKPKVESIDDRISRGCNAPGANTNALGAGGNEHRGGLGEVVKDVVDWSKTETGQKVTKYVGLVISAAEFLGGAALVATGHVTLGKALANAGLSSAIGGIMNEKMGGSFFGGWAGGQASGFISGWGLGKASDIASSIVKGISLAGNAAQSAGQFLAAPGIYGLFGGGLGSAVTQYIDNGFVDVAKAAQSGAINGIGNMYSSVLGLVPEAIETESTMASFIVDTTMSSAIGASLNVISEAD